jgi:8-amino-7-oxononanoate synthase
VNVLARYQSTLNGLERKGRLRTLTPRQGIDFSSHDYLGLATSEVLAHAVTQALAHGTGVGSGGSRLLRGHCPEHEALEYDAAGFFHAERVLFFNSGYTANLALLSTLPQRGDLILLDEYIHASAHDGVRNARAPYVFVGHNNPSSVEDALKTWEVKRQKNTHPWIVVDSLYGMDGDFAPLGDLMALADRYEGFLVIDEAHATGVFGPQGRGLAAHLEGRDNVMVVHTCSKALGASGALVTGPGVLCDFLINRARPFIYATALSPLMAVAVQKSLEILQEESERQARLTQLVAFAHKTLAGVQGLQSFSGSPILPVMTWGSKHTMVLAAYLQNHGFDVRGIRPPSVPEGSARLRISITLNVSEADIESLHSALNSDLIPR